MRLNFYVDGMTVRDTRNEASFFVDGGGGFNIEIKRKTASVHVYRFDAESLACIMFLVSSFN